MSCRPGSVNKKIYCCDPFRSHRRRIHARLRLVPLPMIKAHPSLGLRSGDRACCNCLNAIRKVTPDVSPTREQEEQAGPSTPSAPSTVAESSALTPVGTDTENSDDAPPVTSVNEILGLVGVSPIGGKRNIRSHTYVKEKITRAEGAIRKAILFAVGDEAMEQQDDDDDGREMIEQLKEKFTSTTSRSERLTILTVLPKRWSVAKVMEEFGVTNYMARSAKKLVEDKGVLSTPDSKAGHPLSSNTLELVRRFYYHDDISRVMSGQKDFISVRNTDGVKVREQKRLVLSNLKEAYHQFKVMHQGVKVGFSKFAQLRPKECVLAGKTGTHSVCVCVTHQNTKLMMAGGRLDILTQGELKHYTDCLAFIQCEPPTADCANGVCTECRGTEALREELEAIMEENSVDSVQFNQWVNTDRAMLETHVVSKEDYLDQFIEVLKKLRLHDFIAKNQARFVSEKKEHLSLGEFLVIGDFSENYSFIVQDEVQSFHWNNLQATVHPFLCYYKEVSGNLTSISFTIISENKEHDTVAVHLFQRKLIKFLTDHFGTKPTKIIYVSDGCAGQYKNCYNLKTCATTRKTLMLKLNGIFFATACTW